LGRLRRPNIKHNARKLAPSGGPSSLHVSRLPARQTVLICVMSGAPGPAGCAKRTAIHQGRCAASHLVHEQKPGMALSRRRTSGAARRPVMNVSPAHPSVCCARAAAAERPSLRARSQPPVRPHGAPQSEERKGKKRASHAVQAAMSSCTALLSVELWWPSRPGPAGARCATLTGLASGWFAKVGAVLAQWDTTVLFRRVCRRAARAVKPGGTISARNT
jgi:hypothetical protein